MVITNRSGHFNDSMFKEMELFAQHQIKTNPFRQEVKLYKDDTEIAVLEDFKAVFTIPCKVQIKCRVSKALISKILKQDNIKIKITSKGPLKEPPTTYEVVEWFEPLEGVVKDIEKTNEVYLSDNKWLYLRGKEI